MKTVPFHIRARFVRLGVPVGLAAVIACFALVGNGCETGGKEGDVCNPLVLQDECNSGLHCQQITCAKAFCCPVNGSSNEPNCNTGNGCPTEAEAGTEDGGDAGSDSGDAAATADAIAEPGDAVADEAGDAGDASSD